MTPPRMSPSLFAIWSGFVEERFGLHYAVGDAEILADKLWTRAQEAGFATLLDYYYYLRYDDPDGAELEALADALVVGESYLFRELDQLEAMVASFVAPLVAAGRRARVWSAACAGGEEPLSVAMLLARRGMLDGVELVASDLSPRALERARARVYSRRALRAEPPCGTERFLEVDERHVRVSRRLAPDLELLRINLVDAGAVASLGEFDVILCRNVLIYFSDETLTRVVANLAGALVPGGALFVGVSESLLRFSTTLACEEHGGAFAYRRPR